MPEPRFAKPDRYKLDSYRTYNDRWVETYDDCIWQRVCQVALWDDAVVAELLPAITELEILDVGCASGRLLCSLARAGAAGLHGTDLAPRILETARDRLASAGCSAELKAADAEEHIPWPDDSFDAVTITGVLHHMTRPKETLKEIGRVLRASGRLVVVDVRWPPLLRQFLNLCLRVRPANGDYRYYTAREIGTMLNDLGWRKLRTARVGRLGFMISAHMPKQRIAP
jgi:ubiquinone/menaquinone biosynthesis C-methylase UbiE